jgi:hypothetical protein
MVNMWSTSGPIATLDGTERDERGLTTTVAGNKTLSARNKAALDE